MTNLVIDASAGVDLLLSTPTGRALLPQLPANAQWWAPEHYFSEVAGVLRRLELQGALQPARAADHLQAALVTTDLNMANAPTLTVPTIQPLP